MLHHFGGGLIVKPENIESLKKNGIIFWLVADEQTIVDRIKDGTQRPSLSGSKSFVDEVAEILAERTPKYRAAADRTIDTAQNAAEEAAAAIAEIMLEHHK
jgi:shikimate kinase